MSLTKKEYDSDDFTGTVYTLVCDTSNQKMIDILVRGEGDADAPITKITAKWAGNEFGEGSGEQTFTGLLHYGPIEDEDFSTEIADIQVDNEEDYMSITAYMVVS
jgi:hypothetical protein